MFPVTWNNFLIYYTCPPSSFPPKSVGFLYNQHQCCCITRKAEIAPERSIALDLKLLHSLPVPIHKLEFMINPQPTSEPHQPFLFITIFRNIENRSMFLQAMN